MLCVQPGVVNIELGEVVAYKPNRSVHISAENIIFCSCRHVRFIELLYCTVLVNRSSNAEMVET